MDKAIAIAKSDKAGEKMWFWYPRLDCDRACNNSIILDPKFWQALEAALEWKGRHNWVHYAHMCFRHIMAGKDIDSFFDKILK